MTNFVNVGSDEVDRFVAANETENRRSNEGINFNSNEKPINPDLNFDLVEQIKKKVGENVLSSDSKTRDISSSTQRNVSEEGMDCNNFKDSSNSDKEEKLNFVIKIPPHLNCSNLRLIICFGDDKILNSQEEGN